MQVPGRVAVAAALWGNNFDRIANGRRVHGLQKCKIIFVKRHGVSH